MNLLPLHKIAILPILLFCCIIPLSCNRNKAYDDTRSDEFRIRISAIDDSLVSNSPYAKKTIEDNLAKTHDSIDFYELYIRLSRYYVTSATPDSAKESFARTISFARLQKRTPRICSILSYAYTCKAEYYRTSHKRINYEIKLRHLSYEYSIKSCDKIFIPDACANLADTYTSVNDMPRSAFWYRRALFLVESLKLPAIENATLYMGLGQVYTKLKDYKQAYDCLSKLKNYFPSMDPRMQVYFLNIFGSYYYNIHDYNNALNTFLKLEKFLIKYKLQNNYLMYICKMDLSDVYLNLGKLNLSVKYLDEVQPILENIHDEVCLYYCHTIRIGQALRQNRLSDINNILNHEKFTVPIEQNLIDIRRRYIMDYYIQKKDFHKAFLMSRENETRTDSLMQNRIFMSSSEIMMRFAADTLSLHHQIAMQEKDAQMHQDRTVLIISIIMVILLILVILLGIVSSRKRHLQDSLDIMKLRLDNARNRISPHFVFNVLNNKITNTDKKEADELMAMTKLIRASLSISSKAFISLREELEFIQYYIDIQQHLIGDSLHYEVNLSPSINQDTMMIPSMFIQILVENSIKHGLAEKEGDKNILVDIHLNKNGATNISVIDNGSGFDIRHSNAGSTKTGLSVIRNTISIINQRKKQKMLFAITNLTDGQGKTTGCKSTITIYS